MSESFKSFALITASGKTSKARGVDVSDHTLKTEDGREKRIADSVKNYVVLLEKEKEVKTEKEQHSEIIRTHATAIRNYFRKHGTYLKTYRLIGDKINDYQYAVDVMENDKFSAPSINEDIQNLKTTLGENIFDQIFEEITTISIKKSVMDDENQRKELSKLLFQALGTDGIKKFFDRGTKWIVKEGLSEKIHTYEEKIQNTIRENLKQSEDSIKDASSIT